MVSTEPQGRRRDKITWNLGDLDAGQAKVLKVTAKADKAPWLRAPRFTPTPGFARRPSWAVPSWRLTSPGPRTPSSVRTLPTTIVVRTWAQPSPGRGRDRQGSPPDSAAFAVPFTVGDLAPGASKTIPITLKAAERGSSATLPWLRPASVQDDACTEIFRHLLKVTKTGTPNNSLGSRPHHDRSSQPGDRRPRWS